METYSILRQFADSWALLVMFTFFVSAILWVFRPGSRSADSECSNIVFRHDNGPEASMRATQTKEAAQ